jgi:DNA-binding MarR family transcriptional regulator
MEADRDPLALDEQLCFALAVASRAVVMAYRPVLEPIGLTHPQYLVMLALWQHREVSVGELSALLHLDAGTLSPLLKRLERAGLVDRSRSPEDERVVRVSLTQEGKRLRRRALQVPTTMLDTFGMDVSDLDDVNRVLHGIIDRAAAAGAA